jgi:hypothetical protein
MDDALFVTRHKTGHAILVFPPCWPAGGSSMLLRGMDNLVCMACGTTYYSAAPTSMVERGERCDCGGELRMIDDDEEDCHGVNLTVITSPSRI